jgi:hypothetical protein
VELKITEVKDEIELSLKRLTDASEETSSEGIELSM